LSHFIDPQIFVVLINVIHRKFGVLQLLQVRAIAMCNIMNLLTCLAGAWMSAGRQESRSCCMAVLCYDSEVICWPWRADGTWFSATNLHTELVVRNLFTVRLSWPPIPASSW